VEGGDRMAGELRGELGVARPRATAEPALDVVGTTADGEAIAVGVVGGPHHTLIAFLSSGSRTCPGFWAPYRWPATPSLQKQTRPASRAQPVTCLRPASPRIIRASIRRPRADASTTAGLPRRPRPVDHPPGRVGRAHLPASGRDDRDAGDHPSGAARRQLRVAD